MNIKKNKIIGPKAYIDLDVCRSNLSAIKKRIGGRKLLCVIKANGYGHGAVQIAKAIENFKNVQAHTAYRPRRIIKEDKMSSSFIYIFFLLFVKRIVFIL